MAVSGAQLVAYGKKFLGVPYVWGGTTPKGFDCSGLMQYVYKHFGITLPRVSQDQAKVGTKVNYPNLQMGDLVISDWGSGWASHVGMYIGGGKVLEAPRRGVPVRIIALDANYRAHVNTYRRVKGVSSAPATVSTASFGIPGLPDINLGLDDVTGLIGKLGGLIEKGGGTIVVPLPGGLSVPLPLDEAKKFLESLKKWGDASGTTGDIAEGLGSIISFPADIIGFFKTATEALGDVSEFFLAFFRPSTYVRIACGWFGFVFLATGLFFLIREGRTSYGN